jgi:hypothetical protein
LRTIQALLAAALVIAATPARAEIGTLTEQDQADARCYIAVTFFKAAAPKLAEKDKAKLDEYATFFIGKIRGRHPPSTPINAIITPELVVAMISQIVTEAPICFREGRQVYIDTVAMIPVLRNASPLLKAQTEEDSKSKR